MRFLTFILLAALPQLLAAHPTLKQQEDSLKVAIRRVAAMQDTVKKLALNRAFSDLFGQSLAAAGGFDYPFDSVPYLYRAASEDKRVRVITWTVPVKGAYRYFGFVQMRENRKSPVHRVVALTDVRIPTPLAVQEVLAPREWFGALYTEVVEKRHEQKTYYTLLGLSLNDERTTKKVVDVLCIQADSVVFGAPIFERKKKPVQYRMIFEYSARSVMQLKYNKKLEVIAFSALESLYPQLRGQYEYYVAGDSYDGLKFEQGKWNYVEKVKVPSDVKRKVRR
ncbi:MAG: hypothetical protein LBK47_04650 [Prevotellaceae bacterium]|jgi:hypothetical protein|nr:hypothetical protein [Prevotellaceae bacterium]